MREKLKEKTNVGALSVRNTKKDLPNCAQKGNKGITLVALIITIIVLLILAVVAIRAVQGDGIISHAKNARDQYELAQANEQAILDSYLQKVEDNLPEGASIGKATVGTIVNKNSTINGETYSSTNPVIPAGFKAINTDTSAWDVASGPEVTKGLVISDGTNEFVWVPIETELTYTTLEPINYYFCYTGLSDEEIQSKFLNCLQIYNTIAGTSYENSEDFLNASQAEFKYMVENVNKYQGFYVGRYETSLSVIEGKKVGQSVKGTTSATMAAESANTWYGLYAIQRNYSTNSVQGSMLWGKLYIKMIDWLKATVGDNVIYSIGDNRNTDRTTGTKETDKVNNIYDLYGNSLEWTNMVGYSQSADVDAGFNLTETDLFNGITTFDSTKSNAGDAGSRLVLYIK